MKAAVEARAGSSLKILAVTVLTSYDDADLARRRLSARRRRAGRGARRSRRRCSASTASSARRRRRRALRKIVGHQMVLVTPGIRPAGAATGDQKRIMTPARAIAAGADYLVVGRPILEAADPKAAADAIVRRRSHRRWLSRKGERDGKGLLDRARRCAQRRRLQGLRRGQPARSSRNSAAASWCAAASSRSGRLSRARATW